MRGDRLIVFFGRPDDRPLAGAVEQVVARGLPHVVLDQTQLSREDLLVDLAGDRIEGRLRACGAEVELGAISAVYARPLSLGRSADGLERARGAQLNTSFLEWLDEASCLVVNRPRAMQSNLSKPYQLQLVAAAGLAVPATLVTNRPAAVRDFQSRHGRVVYKSLSGIRSVVTELDGRALSGLERVRWLPTQFQEYVDGVDIRVHVVGDSVFATEISSDAIDYRYADRDGVAASLRPTELTSATERRCRALAKRLGLPFCGIDLRRRPDGEHVCFEVNPMPAYSYFANWTGQPIAEALVDLLANTSR